MVRSLAHVHPQVMEKAWAVAQSDTSPAIVDLVMRATDAGTFFELLIREV